MFQTCRQYTWDNSSGVMTNRINSLVGMENNLMKDIHISMLYNNIKKNKLTWSDSPESAKLWIQQNKHIFPYNVSTNQALTPNSNNMYHPPPMGGQNEKDGSRPDWARRRERMAPLKRLPSAPDTGRARVQMLWGDRKVTKKNNSTDHTKTGPGLNRNLKVK